VEKTLPSSLTIEEAVAEMVNMDYIPAGFTLLEMIDAFREVSEVEYENACIDRLSKDQLTPLKIRMDSCKARHTLTQLLLESLQYEVKNRENSMIAFAKDSSSHPRLTRDSVWEWAADKYGIGISLRSSDSNKADMKTKNSVHEKLKNASWEGVTIKIWKDHRIGLFSKKQEIERSTFRKIGLMRKDKELPNHLGGILIGLSKVEKYPDSQPITPKEKTAISKLRKVLFQWTGLSDDPFMPYNNFDGWKPRFKLIDDTKNADKRAEEKAFHVSYDDSMKYGDDTDD
jgi:hypothetical protein